MKFEDEIKSKDEAISRAKAEIEEKKETANKVILLLKYLIANFRFENAHFIERFEWKGGIPQIVVGNVYAVADFIVLTSWK